MYSFSPWVEKYRPSNLNDVVLDNTNKTILNNILDKNYFPNLLLYGPPGTGKTTTIINLINAYQKKFNQYNKGHRIHLNASDDRGIEIIRNQIYQFVHTKTMFGNGLKFVILDEVDYMTKNAQQALRYLIQKYSKNIRFCLICNYISRIEGSLQNEFIRLRFCQLPEKEIYSFLKNITTKENIKISKKNMLSIQKNFKSDIRSMINYIQINHNDFKNKNDLNYLNEKIWENLHKLFIKNTQQTKQQTKSNTTKNLKTSNITKFFDHNSNLYHIQKKEMIKIYIKYLIDNKSFVYNKDWLNTFKFIIHSDSDNEEYIMQYFIENISELYKTI